MAVRAPLPGAGTFKKTTRRPRTRDTQIGSDATLHFRLTKGDFRYAARHIHLLTATFIIEAECDYLCNRLISLTSCVSQAAQRCRCSGITIHLSVSASHVCMQVRA